MEDLKCQTKFTIKVGPSDIAIQCGEDEKLLFAMEAQIAFPHPQPIKVGCRKGGCGACRIKVKSGDYRTLKMSRDHVSEAEERQGYALACRVLPDSDLTIEPAFRSPRERLASKDFSEEEK
ncbi:MAG: 2Fe-2S iron-sulfur cluster-binding protein [Mangrovicoccus sp.]